MAKLRRSKASRPAWSPPEDLAATLHDTVAQDLTAAVLLADLIATRLQRDGHQDAGLAAALVLKLNATTTQLQKILRRLTPVKSRTRSSRKNA